ncbi:LLM class flavin-dependent oxidoreductase [Tengunoibacter tsumagoiensis]|uniref:LLM class F420-dependent oxidoreductase n=1 Tax=Tengunoibacter tsumagoiensis TaxID=2014871 RepID=A0A402A7Q3_9CHLR|nr:LLM class flavin-dependent oxidoreductase [Tengunoibacter tsumagoiensis]GCE15011.1 LLM class F420-dependent oxidoreductase [Tengunoibacter tsumagoiensis]
MQQKKHFSTIETPRSIRDRVGIFSEATDILDAITKVREAEQAGVQQIWAQNAGDADLVTFFAAVATQTERIRLGSAIVPVYTRHPLTLARQAFAIEDLAPGRLRLGIGPGNRMLIENSYGLAQTTPLSYLQEYLEILRGIFKDGAISHHGTFFNVEHTLLNASMPRRASLPLLTSAVGLKTFRLAGEMADGAISWACPIPYLLESALPELRAGAEERGRSVPPIIAHVRIALSTDEEKVRSKMRQGVQFAARFSSFTRMWAAAGFKRAAEGNEEEIDALVRTLVVSGSEETIRRRLKELLASGLDELMLQLVPIVDEERERKQLIHLVGSL